jgi:dolichyl-phosphate-mannose-protein mannosyltransferase
LAPGSKLLGRLRPVASIRTGCDRALEFFRRRPGLALCAIALLFLLMALYKLPNQDLESDEFITVEAAVRSTMGEVWQNRFSRGHPPLYFLLVWVSVRVGLQSPFFLVLPSILLGLITIPVFHALARRIGLGSGAAILATLLLATHPSFVYLARFARPYGGVILLTCALWWTALRALERRDGQSAFWMLLLGCISAFWNQTLVFVWLGIVASVLLVGEVRRRSTPAFWSALAGWLAAHGLTLWLISFYSQGKRLPLGWIDETTVHQAVKSFVRLLGVMRFFPGVLFWAWSIALFFVAALCIEMWRVNRETHRNGNVVSGSPSGLSLRRFAVGLTLLPLVTIVLVSFYAQPLLVKRYLAFLLPGFFLFGARLLTWERFPCRRTAAILLCMAMVIAGGRVARNHHTGLRRCIQHLEKTYDPSGKDAVLVMGWFNAKRALGVFSPVDFHILHVANDTNTEMAWPLFDRLVTGRERLWVLESKSDRRLIRSPEWKEKVGKRISTLRRKATRLRLYELPKPKPPSEGENAQQAME